MDHIKNDSIIQDQETQGETSASSDALVDSVPSMVQHGNCNATTGTQESRPPARCGSARSKPQSRYPRCRSARSKSPRCRFQRVSPASSCVSMQTEPSFHRHPDSRSASTSCVSMKSPSTICATVSMKSDKSMHPPMDFLISPESSGLSSSVLTADHLRCFVCSSTLRDPVSIPCGHSYCKHCIDIHWSQPGPAGDYECLQCKKSYPARPELSVNVALNGVLEQQTGCTPACDICSSETRPAIKTCVTCSASFCDNHLMSHYTVPAFRKHTLARVN